MPTILVDEGVPFSRETLLAAFRADHIDGRVFFWPLSMLAMFESKPENTVSHNLYKRAINLPSYHDITEQDMDRVIKHVRAHFPG
jgi:perosamine synthetase